MKKYNVTLSNNQSIFDSRDDIETVEEVIAFASGRGASYIVHVDRDDVVSIKAIHNSDDNSYLVDPDWSRMHMTPEKFAAYLRKYL